MKLFGFTSAPAHSRESNSVAALRRKASVILIYYFWISSFAVIVAAALSGASVLAVAFPLSAIGLFATHAAVKAPTSLSTRLVMAVAINATWMFGLYAAMGIHNGAYMLEVHMLYFISGSIILAYACWRAVLITTVAALSHHLLLSVFDPSLVWPPDSHPWFHFMNHSFLGAANCVGGMFAAIYFKRFLVRMEIAAKREKHRAQHDLLTGLLNRRGLKNAVQGLLHQHASKEKPFLSLYQIDLDNFKQINDGFGHGAGDALLIKVARKLEEFALHSGVVARIGGDEFVVAMIATDPSEGEVFLSQFQSFSRQPFRYEGKLLKFGASIGVTNTQVSGHQFDSLLLDGDVALYEAKRRGRNCVFVYSKELRDQIFEARQLEEDVKRALKDREFEPFFQTQHDASTGEIVGAEVLARWCHPEKGVCFPGTFMPLMENMGLVAELDTQIFEKTILFLREQEAQGLNLKKVSINLSYERLMDLKLREQVDSLPELTTKLAFEIVESVVFDDFSDEELSTIDYLRQKGLMIEVDDFGTGHASIIALTSLRPDMVKIDRALIAPLSQHPEQLSLIRSIVDMAHGLGIQTLAEGVERPEEFGPLRSAGVDVFQGYAFSRPVSAEEFRASLSQKKSAISELRLPA